MLSFYLYFGLHQRQRKRSGCIAAGCSTLFTWWTGTGSILQGNETFFSKKQLPTGDDESSETEPHSKCAVRPKNWKNFFQLNEQTSFLSSKVCPHFTNTCWLPKCQTCSQKAGCDLTFEKQVTKVIKSCFYQLRSISKTWSFLSLPDPANVIDAFSSSWLDYCNLLYSVFKVKKQSHAFSWYKTQLFYF